MTSWRHPAHMERRRSTQGERSLLGEIVGSASTKGLVNLSVTLYWAKALRMRSVSSGRLTNSNAAASRPAAVTILSPASSVGSNSDALRMVASAISASRGLLTKNEGPAKHSASATGQTCRPRTSTRAVGTRFLSGYTSKDVSKGRSTLDVPLSTVTHVTCLGTVVLPVCSINDASGFRQYRLPNRLPR